MKVLKGDIYCIKESLYKYRYGCDYIQIVKISLKTFSIHPCYERNNFIYAKKTPGNKRIVKEVFFREIEEGKIKLI